ncbi:hypothetical protein D9M72_582790 [compost metagenome]
MRRSGVAPSPIQSKLRANQSSMPDSSSTEAPSCARNSHQPGAGRYRPRRRRPKNSSSALMVAPALIDSASPAWPIHGTNA